MFHRRYSRSSASGRSRSTSQGSATSTYRHEVKLPETALTPRERLRQRQEEAVLKQQLLETEQALDGLLEEEKELARRREELQILNQRQTEFHDRRLEVEERINQALLGFDRESHRCERDVQTLEQSLATCRRYLDELEELAPSRMESGGSEVAVRRQLEFLADLERRLDAELCGLEAGSSGPEPAEVAETGDFSRSFRRGFRFFLPFLGLGTLGLLLLLSLTGGGR